MAKVEMDLQELKVLEKTIETLKEEKQDLIDRQQQVVIYHKYFNGKIKPTQHSKDHSINITGYKLCRSHHPYGSRTAQEYFNDDVSVQYLFDQGVLEVDLTEDTSKTSKDYKNLSEVISEIRIEESDKVAKQLNEALDRATSAEHLNSTIEDKYKKEFLTLVEKHQDNIDKLTKTNKEKVAKIQEEYSKLKQEFEDFKEDRKRISLEEQIGELTKQLEAAKVKKSFWERVLNK